MALRGHPRVGIGAFDVIEWLCVVGPWGGHGVPPCLGIGAFDVIEWLCVVATECLRAFSNLRREALVWNRDLM